MIVEIVMEIFIEIVLPVYFLLFLAVGCIGFICGSLNAVCTYRIDYDEILYFYRVKFCLLFPIFPIAYAFGSWLFEQN